MKNCSLKKRFSVIAFLLITAVLLSACYSIEATEKNRYKAFRNKMESRDDFMFNVLPELDDAENIEDIYLYYSDWDLLDSMYTVYLNCVYPEDQYTAEYERLMDIADEYTYMTVNSSSFDYDSIVFEKTLDPYSMDMFYLRYTYILFDEVQNRVVYVTAFEKADNLRINNIPAKYLPKEYVSTIQML